MLTALVSLVEETEEIPGSYDDWEGEVPGVGLLDWKVGGTTGINDSKSIGE